MHDSHIFSIFFAEIEKYTVTIDKHEAVAYLTQFDIPCAPVLSMKEISLDPSLRQSGSVVEVEQPLRGKYTDRWLSNEILCLYAGY